MLALIIIIMIILIIYFMCIENDYDLAILPTIVLVVALISALILIGLLVDSNRSVPQEIEMYEEENARIEAQLNILVSQYMEHESNIMNKISEKESAITLISLYPDLKSDQLVQSQIDVYIDNNNKIKELRSKLIHKDVYKFWLYFGGKKK